MATDFRRAAKNSVLLLAENGVATMASLALILLIARSLGSSELGVYSFVMAFAGIASSLINFGFDSLTVREASKKPELAQEYASKSLGIRLIAGSLLITASYAYAHFAGDSLTALGIVFVGFYVTLGSLSQPMKSVFRAEEKMGYEAITNSTASLALVAAAFLLLENGFGLEGVYYSLVVASALNLALTILWSAKKIRLEPVFRLQKLREFAKKAVPFGLMGVVVSVFFATDTLMLGALATTQEIGYYNAAYKLMYSPLFIAFPIAAALYPLLTKKYYSEKQVFRRTLKKALAFFALFPIALAVAALVFPAEIISILYGSGFGKSEQVMRALFLLPVLISVNVLASNTMNAIGKQNENVRNAAIITIANAVMNAVLITSIGFVGAAYATVTSQFLYTAMTLAEIKKAGA